MRDKCQIEESEIDVLIPFHKINSELLLSINSIKGSRGVVPRIIAINDSGIDILKKDLGMSYDDLLIRCIGKGYLSALKTGITNSTARFIAFQDSDDISDPWRLSLQIAVLETTDCDLVSGELVRINSFGKKVQASSPFGSLPNDMKPEERLIFGPHGADSTIVGYARIIKDYWDSHSTFTPTYADYGWLLSVPEAVKMAHCKNAIYYYRSHSDQMSKNATDLLQWEKISKLWLRNLNQISIDRKGEEFPSTKKLAESPSVSLALAFPASRIELDRQERLLLNQTIDQILKLFEYENERFWEDVRETLFRRGFIATRGLKARYWMSGIRMAISLIRRYSHGIKPRNGK